MKPRVLIIENSTDVTGALKSIVRLTRDLDAHFDFYFVVPTQSRTKKYLADRNIRNVDSVPMKELSKRFISLLLYIPYLIINTYRVHRIIKRNEISIIHSNDLYNLIPPLLRLFGSSLPYLCHIRFLPDKFPVLLFNFWIRLHLRYAQKLVVVSYAVKKQLLQHQKIVVIHNELPLNVTLPELVEPDSSRISSHFLYLSNFISGKGQNYALEAFATIHRSLPGWKLRFVGGDMGLSKNRRFRSYLQARAKFLNIAEKVEWIGFTEEVEMEYRQADVVLNFSESESFSLTCLEASYYGRPVIASRCGGPEEIIIDGVTGLMVENRQITEMAEAMIKLAEDKELRVKMGQHAAKYVKEKFSSQNTTLKFKVLYDNILSI
ncbi:MAG: glycosyltransferase family 1 protein [Cytophagia bacterium]|nr:glycosyltransferase family 1 protein [Cytophagia bacterium]